MNSSGVSFAGVAWDYLTVPGRDLIDASEDRISGDLVKITPKRKVVRYEGAYVKEINYRGLSSLIKSILGGTACLEGQISLKLREKGIPVPEILAFGSERKQGFLSRDILVTREIKEGLSLHLFLKVRFADLTSHEKRGLTREFAVFIRQLHQLGVFHADLHIGNIVIVRGESWKFYLLDTDRVRLGKKYLSRSDRIKNLGQLLANLWTLTSRVQRFRFVRNYGIRRDADGAQFIRDVEFQSQKYSNKIWKGKTERSLETNSRFVRECRGHFKVYRVRSDETERILADLFPDPDVILERGEVLKAGHTVLAARVMIGGRPYFLKRYNCKGIGYRLRNAFRRSRAVRTWLTSWGFMVRDLPVPKPLICLEERHFRLLGRTYLLCEFIENSRRLTDLWSDFGDRFRNCISVKMGLLIGRMHRFGCIHGDLKWNNILLRQNVDDYEIFLADLDGSRIQVPIPRISAKKDLGRYIRDLNLSKCGQQALIVFLKSYKRWFPGGQEVSKMTTILDYRTKKY